MDHGGRSGHNRQRWPLVVGGDGGIFSFGDAKFVGSAGSMVLNRPVVGMAKSASGSGYQLVASDGGVFAFGDATFYGSATIDAKAPIIAMTPTSTGQGYWLTAVDGSVYSYGDARYFGGV